MTESFYIRVDIKSNEKLEFYKEDDDDTTYLASPKICREFNRGVEKAIKKVLIENIEVIQEDIDEIEGLNSERQEALEKTALNYYDWDTDMTAVTEMMTQDIKFKVVRAPK